MRILLLNWRDKTDRSYGGAEEFVDRLALELSKNCEVTLFTSRGRGRARERRGKLEIIRRGSINTVYFRAAAYLSRNRSKYDAVIESVSSVPFFSPLVFDRRKVFVVIHHLMGSEVFRTANPPKALAAYLAEKAIPSLYSGARFLVLSDFVKRQLVEAGIKPDSIYKVGGYSPSRRRLREAKSVNPTIVSVGRLVRYKRNDMLIRMFAELRKTVHDAELVIIGDGPERGRLEFLRNSLGLESCVRFTGFLEESRKDAQVSKSWVFATASRIEGLGFSVLQAEEMGLPVVAFGNGGLMEAVRNGYSGFVVREGDKEAFINALYRLVGSGRGKLLKRMSANAKKYAASFKEKDVHDVLDIVMSSLSASPQRRGKPRKAEREPRAAT